MPALVAVVLLSSALAVAACGGSSKPSGPTKAQFAAKADAVCATTRAQINPLITKLVSGVEQLLGGGSSTAAKLVPSVKQLHDYAAAGLAKLRALAQPPGDHAKIAKFLTPLTTIVSSIGGAATALASGNGSPALLQLEQDAKLATQVTSAAQHYGLGKCATLFSGL